MRYVAKNDLGERQMSSNTHSDATAQLVRIGRACLCVGVLAAVTSFTAAATERFHTSTISSVYPLANGNFIIVFDVNDTYCTNASSPKYYAVSGGEYGMTADGLKLLFSAALAAAAQRNSVTIAFDDSTSNCYINRLAVSYN
jgi:hypothetical protein